MKRIAWVTDSTAFLDEDLVKHPDVYSVPMTVVFEHEEYEDGITITLEEFYQKLKVAKVPPKTSQPSIGRFVDLYKKLENNYDHIISIHLSSDLSGTVSSATQAAKLVSIPVTVIDSRVIAYPLTALLHEGILLMNQGRSIEEMTAALTQMTLRNQTYVLVGSLEQLHRSGRMNSAQYYLGSLLNIRPIISLEDGRLLVKEKVRSDKKAKGTILDYLKTALVNKHIKEVYLLYGLYPEEAENWKKEIESYNRDIIIKTFPLCTAIGVHAGEKTVGISWYYS